MGKTFTRTDPAFISGSLADIDDPMILRNKYKGLRVTVTNTGAALTDFAILGRTSPYEAAYQTLIAGSGWATPAGILKEVTGAPATLASGETAEMWIDCGPLYDIKFQGEISSGARNLGTLTLAANPTNAKAVGTGTFAGGIPTAGQTFTVGSTVYTWRAAPTTVAYEVKIGTDEADCCVNMIAAVNLGSGSGTLYGSLTAIHPTVTASQGAGTTVTFTAKSRGTAGNSIATTDTSSNFSFGGATLTGGTLITVTLDGTTYTFKHSDNMTTINDVLIGVSASATCDNFIAAANGAAGEGTTYYTGTERQERVTAAAGAGDTVVVTANADIQNAEGTLIATTASGAPASWGAATLADGVMTEIEVVCIARDRYRMGAVA